jgi:Rrf2 family protein
MKLSSGVEWALHCCVGLSQATTPVPVTRLAEFHEVSSTSLAKQMQSLARAGIVAATEGRDGGYFLARDPANITLLDVVRAIDGDTAAFRCTEIRQRGPMAATPSQCVTPCAIARAMAAAEDAWRSALARTSIADLVRDVDRDTGGRKLPRMGEWFDDGAARQSR